MMFKNKNNCTAPKFPIMSLLLSDDLNSSNVLFILMLPHFKIFYEFNIIFIIVSSHSCLYSASLKFTQYIWWLKTCMKFICSISVWDQMKIPSSVASWCYRHHLSIWSISPLILQLTVWSFQSWLMRFGRGEKTPLL